MTFVNEYLSIMALQMDISRNKMAIHLQEIMEDGATFGCMASDTSLPWGLDPALGARQGHLGG